MDLDQILSITRVFGIPAIGGVFWLWRQVFVLKKDIALLQQSQEKTSERINNLPSHKDNQRLLEALRGLDKTLAVNREAVKGDIRALQAEIKTELKTLKEVAQRHEEVIREK